MTVSERAAGPRVGLAGLGNMGGGIAGVLARAGMLACAWDPRPGAADGLPEGAAAEGPAELAGCDVVLLAVPGSPQIAELMAAGLIGSGSGVLVDLTTSDPEATRGLAEQAAAAGWGYLDAAMTGGAAAAAAGRLTLMVGGADGVLSRARPVLDAIAARVIHVGPTGAGHAMKLVHNMVCHTVFLATSEAVHAAARAGIAPERAVEVFNAGNARSFISERRFPDHILTGSFDGRSHVGNLAKDLGMAAAMFDRLGASGPYVHLTEALLSRAMATGMASTDFTRLHEVYDALAAGVTEEPEG